MTASVKQIIVFLKPNQSFVAIGDKQPKEAERGCLALNFSALTSISLKQTHDAVRMSTAAFPPPTHIHWTVQVKMSQAAALSQGQGGEGEEEGNYMVNPCCGCLGGFGGQTETETMDL